jgi:hypothetical protein
MPALQQNAGVAPTPDLGYPHADGRRSPGKPGSHK